MYERLAANVLSRVEARADARVLYASAIAPTPAATLDRLEAELGVALPPEVRSFYSGSDGFGLIWQEGERGQRTAEVAASWSDVCNTDGAFWKKAIWPSRDLSRRGGMICIPRAEEVFRKGYWIERTVPEVMGDELYIDGEPRSDEEVYTNLYPFDFITTYYVAGLWYDVKNARWRVLVGGDYGAVWGDYATLEVGAYLDLLERSLGGGRALTASGDRPVELWPLRVEEG